MTASRIFLTPFELADCVSLKAVIVHNFRRGNENTAGLDFRVPDLQIGIHETFLRQAGISAPALTRRALSCGPKRGRAAGACRAFRSASGAARPRNRSSAALSGVTGIGCKTTAAPLRDPVLAKFPASVAPPL